ncbi:hypothetical protein NC653_036772 [Populus alba x Populus x berolinensis]|uniref:Uncharacterized protein n=1 Tax=Populus alba x Populus x berolinensis TaxID=444605 RepID=A0AAD6PV91_9ROSI|nr:hypothetical protein NC653_036772 [Populus alba x Populus x berolinensis]
MYCLSCPSKKFCKCSLLCKYRWCLTWMKL